MVTFHEEQSAWYGKKTICYTNGILERPSIFLDLYFASSVLHESSHGVFSLWKDRSGARLDDGHPIVERLREHLPNIRVENEKIVMTSEERVLLELII